MRNQKDLEIIIKICEPIKKYLDFKWDDKKYEKRLKKLTFHLPSGPRSRLELMGEYQKYLDYIMEEEFDKKVEEMGGIIDHNSKVGHTTSIDLDTIIIMLRDAKINAVKHTEEYALEALYFS